MLDVGDTAPDFTLPDLSGEPVTLSELRGRAIVLYFYPRADTPGCTTQACGVRDRHADYERAGARVLGISPDAVSKVAKFADKHELDFTLLADADHAVADDYGTWGEKSPNKLPQQRQGSATPREGKTFWGVRRATFIIDPQGTVPHVIPKASPKTHDDEVLAALERL